jgi:hypothetical protein
MASNGIMELWKDGILGMEADDALIVNFYETI